MTLELRYRKSIGSFIPERKDNGTWVPFKKNQIKNITKIDNFLKAIYDMPGSGRYYSNTNSLYFDDEVLLMAFIGAIKTHLKDEIKEIDFFIDEA